MSSYCLLSGHGAITLHKYFVLLREADENRDRDIAAAKTIQKCFRAYLVRRHFRILHRAATTITKLWRSACARTQFAILRQNCLREQQMAYYDCLALNIQKCFKGSHSRKHVHYYYRRKQWLNEVTQKGEMLRRSSAEALEKQKEEYQVEWEKQTAIKFQAKTENLHHLLGTHKIPGVLNSPYNPEKTATAFGIPMEDHIRDSFKNRQARLIQEKKMQRQLSNTKK